MYTKDDHKNRVVVGYLAFGNSLWDLLGMYLDPDDIESLYDDIVEDQKNGEEDPEMLGTYEAVGKRVEERQMSVLEG